MSDTTQGLINRISDVNRRIDDLKTRHAKLMGERTAITTRLKEEFGVRSLKEASAKLDEMESSIAAEEAELQSTVTSLEAEVRAIEDALR